MFPTVGEAMALSVELRAFSPRELRDAMQTRDGGPRAATPTVIRIPTATASTAAGTPIAPRPTASPTRTATPRAPTPTPRPTSTPASRSSPTPIAVADPMYGVVVGAPARLYEVAGGQLSSRPLLVPGSAVGVVGETTGVDGQRYIKLDSNLWLSADKLAIFDNLDRTAAAAYDWTMAALAPESDVHPDAAPALWVLSREAELRYLADAIRDLRIPIRASQLPDSRLIATYSFTDRAINVSEAALAADIKVLATSLAHEATHAWEHSQGLELEPGARCFEAELRAFRNQARLWEIFNGPAGKAKPNGGAEEELNEILKTLKEDPQKLKIRLVQLYGDQCGYHGPRPELTPPATAATVTPVPAKPGPPAKPTAPVKAKVATP